MILDLSNADYHALPSVSKSGLDLISKAPAYFKWRRENPQPPTEAMILGTLTHTAVLEPDRFDAEIVVAQKFDRRTTVGKLAAAQFEAENAGKEVLEAEAYDQVMRIRDAVFSHPAARVALSNVAHVEASMFWTDPQTGLECRCRPDAFRTNDVIVDLKTTKDASPEGFAKSIANYRYHVQAPFYMDGFRAATGREAKGFVFVAVETAPPHLVAVYVLNEIDLIRGRATYQRDLSTLRKCLDLDEWPGYPEAVQEIRLPKWA
jgi:hypothetical protein